MKTLASCSHRGNEFLPRTVTTRFCSVRCRKARYEQEHGLTGVSRRYAINKIHVGAWSELKVCADLLQRGYHVFRSVAAHASTDLIIFRDGGPMIRVEVRTAYERNGRLYYPKPKEGRSEVIALCTEDHVFYEPPLDD